MCICSINTYITPISSFLEAMLAIHGTHHLWTFIALADVTAIIILLETMLTELEALVLRTFIALANITAIIIFLETMFTMHGTHDIITCRFLLTSADLKWGRNQLHYITCSSIHNIGSACNSIHMRKNEIYNKLLGYSKHVL